MGAKVDDSGSGVAVRGGVVTGVGAELAHLRQAHRGAPGWGQTQRWGLVGQTPSISTYDALEGKGEDDFFSQVSAGIKRVWERLPLSAPTMTRQRRHSAQINSLPAARFFGAIAGTTGSGAGTGQAFSHAFTALTEGSLHQNFNPNQMGSKELHPATTYDPYPSPGSLYPKAV